MIKISTRSTQNVCANYETQVQWISNDRLPGPADMDGSETNV